MVKKVFYYVFLSLLTMLPIQAMLFDMPEVEKELVKQEIIRRGFDSIKREVDTAQDSKLLLGEDQQGYYLIHTTKLKIERVFDKSAREIDSLTQLIFSEIEKIESKDEYKTEKVINPDQHQEYPTHYIGSHDTRYYWLDDAKQLVKIESNLTSRKALNKILETYKK